MKKEICWKCANKEEKIRKTMDCRVCQQCGNECVSSSDMYLVD